MSALFAAVTAQLEPVKAAEDAKGIYLLGLNTSVAGIVPPPGTYVVNYKYFYNGDASGQAAAGVALQQLGDITLQADIDVDVNFFVDIPTALWVAPGKVLSGNFGVGVLVPVGWQDVAVDVDALTTLTLPDGRTFARGARFDIDDDTLSFGDPLLTAFLGWNRGNLHWKVAGLLNIPIGKYDEDNLANMGFNRWAFDLSGAATWLDPKIGFEVSTVAGFTFNGENPDTDYDTGTEFHVEFALMQHFSKAFSIGLGGYHYQQVTGDSGAGAKLGPFEGRVTALGPNMTYNFVANGIPVATSLRWFHEFDTKNRLEGDAFLFSATMPLGARSR